MPQRHDPKNGRFTGSGKSVSAPKAQHTKPSASTIVGKGGHFIPDYFSGYGPGKKG